MIMHHHAEIREDESSDIYPFFSFAKPMASLTRLFVSLKSR